MSTQNTKKMYVDGTYGQIHLRYALNEDSQHPPLVCLHQSPKCSLEFESIVRTAGASRSVYAFDYPGYGMSDCPPSEAHVSIDVYAKEMHIALDKLNVSIVDLLGNHTGSLVALQMAKLQPNRIRHVAMISAPMFTEEERRQYHDMFQPIPLDQQLTRLHVMWQRIWERRTEESSMEWLERSLFQNLTAGEAYEWGHHAAFSHVDAHKENLATLPHRKILLNPRDDLQECTRRAADYLKNGEIIELPDWSYGFLDHYTGQFIDLLTGKLNSE